MTALRADGYNGSVEFDGERITVLRENWRGKMGHGKEPRSAELDEILRVDFKEPTTLLNGHIRFAIPGVEDRSIANDKFCVLFLKKQTSEFVAIREAVVGAMLARGEVSQARVEEIRAARQMQREQDAAAVTRAASFAQYGGFIADYKGFRYGLGRRREIAGAHAEFESGADRSRPTLTRIGAGAILAGPVGAIAGGMFKKDKTKGYVTVVFANGDTVIVDGPAKDEKKMREFAIAVNAISEMEQALAGTTPAEGTRDVAAADHLLKLKELLDAGVLTQEQYDEKSAPLIAQL